MHSGRLKRDETLWGGVEKSTSRLLSFFTPRPRKKTAIHTCMESFLRFDQSEWTRLIPCQRHSLTHPDSTQVDMTGHRLLSSRIEKSREDIPEVCLEATAFAYSRVKLQPNVQGQMRHLNPANMQRASRQQRRIGERRSAWEWSRGGVSSASVLPG